MPRFAPVTDDLADLGGAKWEIHSRARAMRDAGERVIELTIGEPDAALPAHLIEIATRAMAQGRTGYSNGQGEPETLAAIARRYSQRRRRKFLSENIICLPGTQTALFAALMALAGSGGEVIVGDPMYATYEALVRSSGAKMVPVRLQPENGFRLSAEAIAPHITPATRVLFLNSPHNPTGAVLGREDLQEICDLAEAHDLWILCDEVYEDLCFGGTEFASPLDLSRHADRVVVACSISKSHAAPGFRSGWCVGPAEFIERLLPLSETMLFGSQPFIADMTAAAVSQPSIIAREMTERFRRRAELVARHLHDHCGLRVHVPQAGMFALIDVRMVTPTGKEFARGLLDTTGVAVMPGESFGQGLTGWIRVSLTVEDRLIEEACALIASHAARIKEERG